MDKEISSEIVFKKIKHYCVWQERSKQDVKNKLREFELSKTTAADILNKLIEQDYLNEERFAKLFAGSKFRINKWGRYKIEHALKEKKISQENITKAMAEMQEPEYINMVIKLAQNKWNQIIEPDIILRKNKIQFYLTQKGYELDIILQVIKQIEVGNSKK